MSEEKHKDDLEFTGERVVLGQTPQRVEAEHVARYKYTQELVGGKVVLDVACGSGYGTDILGAKAKEVHGVDISQDAVDFARANFTKENVHFKQGGAAKLDFPDAMFDAVVSFETIEHLEHEDTKKYLSEIHRVLKGGGRFYVSTPNKRVVSPNSDKSLVSDYHTHEYVERELVELVEGYGFRTVRMLGQRILPRLAVYWPIRMIADAIGKYILKRRIDLYWIPTGPSVVAYDRWHEPRYYYLIAEKVAK